MTESQKSEIGLARLAGIWCNDQEFWRFLAHMFQRPCSSAQEAAQIVRAECGIASRTLLDRPSEGQAAFHARIRKPYMQWLRDLGKH